MHKQNILAAAAALLMLTSCGSTGGSGSAVSLPDATAEESAAQTPAPEASAEPTAAPAAAAWVVEPAIEADNIDVLRLERGNANTSDYNAFQMHLDDELCVIEQGGKYGLVDYSGNLVVPVEYDKIQLGMNGIYIISTGGGEYEGGSSWTLNAANELESLAGAPMTETVGTAPNRELYWVPDRNSLYISGGVDTWLEAAYTSNVPCAGHVVTAVEYECATQWDGYVLTDGVSPVSDTRYEAAGAFSSGLIPMKQNGAWGYLNAAGETVLPFEFEGAWTQPNGDALAYAASYGCVVVARGGQYALYDTAGNCLIDFGTYEALRPVWGDKLWAKQDGKWGVLQLSAPLAETQTGASVMPAGLAVEPDVTENGYTVVADADSGLVLRAGPGTEYDRLGSIPKGTQMQVLGSSSTVSGWLYVAQGGWVSAEYVLTQ